MPASICVREDFTARELRRLAARAKFVNEGRRLLALAAVRDGMSRGEAAKIGGLNSNENHGESVFARTITEFAAPAAPMSPASSTFGRSRQDSCLPMPVPGTKVGPKSRSSSGSLE